MKRRIALATLLATALVASAVPAGASTATFMSERVVAGKPSSGGYGNVAYTTGSVVYTKVLDEQNDLIDLYRYSTSSSTSKRAFEADGLDLGRPRISGKKVVYSRQASVSATNSDIFVRDFSASSTGKETRLTTNAAEQTEPDISGDRVVWTDTRNGGSDIYLYDLKTQKESVVATDTGDQTSPSISGTKVVYASNQNGDWDIYAHDVVTGKQKRLTVSSGNQMNPVISGSNVVYETLTGTSAAIRHVKIGTNAVGDITASSSRGLSIGVANQYAPDVSGNRVVWVFEQGSTSALYYYDLNLGTRHKLFSGKSLIDSPQISGSKIAYIKTDTKGASRVYLATLKLPKLSIAAAPAKVKSGSKAKITGKLRTSGGSALAKRWVRIEKSTDNKNWTVVYNLKTSSSGSYCYKTGAIKQKTYYRASYKGGTTYLSTTSSVKTVGLK